MNLRRLQSMLLHRRSSVNPTEILTGIQGTYINVGVVHVRSEGMLDLLIGAIRVWENSDKVELRGRWSIEEILSITTALDQIASDMISLRIIEDEEEKEQTSVRTKIIAAQDAVENESQEIEWPEDENATV